MDRKGVASRIEIKDADKGTFAALVSTYMVIDKDGDVTHPGAFPEGKRVPVSSYGHTSWEGQLPVGSATLRNTRTEAIAEGRLYLDTPDGLKTWTTLKAQQEDGIPSEWSYGFDPKDYSFGEFEGRNVRFLKQVDVHEVSPVLIGAGVGTQTLDIKSARGAGRAPMPTGYRGGIAPHDTATTDERWDAYEAVKSLGVAPSIVDLRAMHAYVDPTGDPERKASYFLMHHKSPDAPANIRACLLGIAALNGARGPQIPDDAKREAYAHLAAHLRDADRTVPDLASGSGTLKLRDQIMVTLADITTLTGRMAEIGVSRSRKNEAGLTRSNRELLSWIDEELSVVRGMLATPDEMTDREWLRFLARDLNF